MDRFGASALAPAAVDAINRAKYRPFKIDGRSTEVMTVVVVRFSMSANPNSADEVPEVKFQDAFWKEMESAQLAIANADVGTAKKRMEAAAIILKDAAPGSRHGREQWTWTTTMGDLLLGEQKFEVAEQQYRSALKIYKDEKESPELAASLANLGRLFFMANKYDLARDFSGRSIEVYRKNLKQVESAYPELQIVYGRAIALQASMLSKVADENHDSSEHERQCQVVAEFGKYMSEADRQLAVNHCAGTHP